MEKEIIALLEKILDVPAGTVTVETEIGELPEWDSLHNVQIIAELEGKYHISIQYEDIMDLENVADIIDMVEEFTKK